jgi:hypothetical protein
MRKIFYIVSAVLLYPLLGLIYTFAPKQAYNPQSEIEHCKSQTGRKTMYLPAGPGVCYGQDELIKVDPKQVKADVEKQFAIAKDHVLKGDLRKARQVVSLVEHKVRLNRKIFSRAQRDEYKARVESLNASIQRKVESLIKQNLAILRDEGSKAAISFRRGLASRNGISDAELASVDEAILNYASVEQEEREKEMRRRARRAIQQGKAAEEFDEPEMRAIAEREARMRADSIATEKAHQDSIARVEAEKARRKRIHNESVAKAEATKKKIIGLIAQKKGDEAYTVFQIYEKNLKKYLSQEVISDLKEKTQDARAQHRQKTRWASKYANELTALVEEDKGHVAYKRLRKHKGELKAYMLPEAYQDLVSAVKRSNSEYKDGLSKAKAAASRISALLKQEKAERAYKTYQKRKAGIEKYLESSVHAALRAKVEGAYEHMQDKEEWAALYEKDIRNLIKAKRGTKAYALFQKGEADLRKYMKEQAFADLEAEVSEANLEFKRKNAKAIAGAAKLKTLIAEKEIEKAFTTFEKGRTWLKHYLNNDAAYADIRSAVYEANRELQAKKKWAAGYAKSITTLLERNEGRLAYEKFGQQEKQLAQYLDAAAYNSLKSAVDEANTTYLAKQKKAQQIVRELMSLLVERKEEDAYALFEKSQRGMAHYLDNDTLVQNLRTRVHTAYRRKQERKRWAASLVKDIQSLIEQREGLEAHERYEKNAQELKLYVDAQTIASVGKAVVKAKQAYLDNRAKAQKTQLNVEKLLTAEKAAKAYETFRGAESSLKHYLPGETFSGLSNRTQTAYKALLDKRKWAVQYVREIEGFIAKKEGHEAFAHFEKEKTQLAKYLDSVSMQNLQAAAEGARDENLLGEAEAQFYTSQIEQLLTEKRAHEAYAKFNEAESDLQRYLPEQTYAALKSKVETAYDDLQDKQKEALEYVRSINALLEKRQGGQAQEIFNAHQAKLKESLHPESYESLRARVAGAAEIFAGNLKKASNVAELIHVLLAKNDIDEAYANFENNRSDLVFYLPQTVFSSLEASVLEAHGALMEKKKSSRATVNRIKKLLRRDQAAEAYNEFEKVSAMLKRNLSSRAFDTLEKNVKKAHEELLKQEERARKLVTTIYVLLESDKADSASTVFRENREALKKHVERSVYELVEETIKKEYGALRGRRAEAQMRSQNLLALLDAGRISDAYKGFKKERKDLKKYLNSLEYKDLEERIKQAKRRRK